jgi:hypothetical protein
MRPGCVRASARSPTPSPEQCCCCAGRGCRVDDEADHLVGEIADARRLPVGLELTSREEAVERGLDHRERHRLRDIRERRRQLPERLKHVHALLGIARVDGCHYERLLLVHRLRQVRVGRESAREQDRLSGHLVRSVVEELAVPAEDGNRVRERVEGSGERHDRSEGVKPEGERGNDAEVPSPPRIAPNKSGVDVGGCSPHLAVSADDLCADQVVAGKAVLAPQPAVAAAELCRRARPSAGGTAACASGTPAARAAPPRAARPAPRVRGRAPARRGPSARPPRLQAVVGHGRLSRNRSPRKNRAEKRGRTHRPWTSWATRQRKRERLVDVARTLATSLGSLGEGI